MKHGRQTAHDCPVAGCPRTRRYWQAVCDSCWARVPDDIRGRIASARAAKAKHREGAASIEAVAWLNAHSPAAIAARRLGESGFQEGVL